MKMTQTHRDTLSDLLTWRRDMRHFRTDPLSGADIDAMRNAMDQSPSVGNSRPWRVIQVENPALRDQVRANFTATNAEAAETYVGHQREAYLAQKLAGLNTAPLHLAVFTETAPTEGHGLGRMTMPGTLEQSTVMAVHAMWLTARARNIGVGMLSILDPGRMTALFETPTSWHFTAYLCIGYPEFDDDTPLLHRTGWQENTPTEWDIR